MTATLTPKNKKRVLALGAALLVVGIVGNIYIRSHGFNDFAWIYVLGKMMLAGQNGYDFALRHPVNLHYAPDKNMELQPYPPASALVLLPLIALPLSLASWLLFILSIAVMLTGLWRFLRCFAPEVDPAFGALLLGATLCSATVRWSVLSLQSGTLVVGLLCLYLIALKEGRFGLAVVWGTLALCLKFTNSFPFLAIALLQRRFRLAAALAGAFFALNLVGFARMGGVPALNAYRWETTQIENPRRIDAAQPWNRHSLQRLDWTYLLNAVIPNPGVSRTLGGLLSLLSLLYLGWEGWRAHGLTAQTNIIGMFLTPIVCLNILMVYHHYYEGVFLLPAFFFTYAALQKGNMPRAVGWLLLPAALYFGLAPRPQMENMALAHASMGVVVAVRVTGCVALIIAYGVSLWALHHAVSEALSNKQSVRH